MLQRGFILRFAPASVQKTAHGGEQEEDWEPVKRIADRMAEHQPGHVGHEHRADDARHHAPEIAVAVEPPPIPLQHVSHDVAAVKRSDNPHHDVGDARRQQAEQNSDQ